MMKQALLPGDHLVEVLLRRPTEPATLQEGLKRIGFVEVTLDQSLVMRGLEEPQENEWSEATFEGPPANRYRFVARLEEPVTLEDTHDVSWGFAHQLRFDPLSEIEGQNAYAYHLLTDETYEVRVIARRSFQDKFVVRQKARNALERMGFEVHKLACLHRDMRLPRTSSIVGLWLGIVTWRKSMSIIHEEDPLYFEDLEIIDSAKDVLAQGVLAPVKEG